MRFSIAVAALSMELLTAAGTAEGPSAMESIQQERYQHFHLRHIQSWQRGKQRQVATRKMRASSFGGLRLHNYYLPKDPLECSLPELSTHETADLGILSSCPANTLCLAHAESSLGGFCHHRHLQQPDLADTGEFCRSDTRFAALDQSCDCSGFDTNSQQGSFACLVYSPGHCFQENICGSLTIQQTFSDYHKTEYCYAFDVPISSTLCYHYMVNTGDPNGVKSCAIVVDEVYCNYCRVSDQGIDGFDHGCLDIDCSNTAARVAGNDCLGGLVLDAILKDLGSEPTIVPTLEFSTRLPAPSPNTPTNAPTVGSVSDTDQTSDEPKFSLTMAPGINLPRFSLTAPPAMVSTSLPTLAPSSSPSNESNSSAGSTLTPTPGPTSTSSGPTPSAASTSPPTISPTFSTPTTTTPIPTSSTPQESNETRGPNEISSITGSGTTTGSAAISYRRATTSMVFSLVVLVTLASLVLSG